MKKFKFILLYISLALFIFSITAIAKKSMCIRQFNKEERVLNLSDGYSDKNVEVTINVSNPWQKIMPEDFVYPEYFDHDFTGMSEYGNAAYGATYTFAVNNLSYYTIDEWSFELTTDTNIFLNKAWTGSVEFFQEGGKKHDIFKSLQENYEQIKIDSIPCSELTLFPLAKGDRIIYHPSTQNKEQPLEKNCNTSVGAIFYTEYNPHDFSLKIKDGKLSYHAIDSLANHKSFMITFAGILILSIFLFTSDLIIFYYDKKTECQRKKDQKIIRQAIETFSNFIDSKDEYTNCHSRRVAEYSYTIAKSLGYPEEDARNVYYIGLLHDAGKVEVPNEILNKPAPLTEEEFNKIKEHTTSGERILKNFTAIPHINEGALYHHERYDGSGYPTGKKGAEIPEVARIIAVADSYDAMNSDRCYKKKLDKEKIISEIKKNRGIQFDPVIADTFLECLKKNLFK